MRKPSLSGLAFSFILSYLLPLLEFRSCFHRFLDDEVVQSSPHNRPATHLSQVCFEGM